MAIHGRIPRAGRGEEVQVHAHNDDTAQRTSVAKGASEPTADKSEASPSINVHLGTNHYNASL